MLRVESFSLLAPAWSSSFFVMSRVDSFSLLAPAWGSSPTWSSSLLMSRVDSFSLLAPAWGDSFVDVPRGQLLVVSSRVEQFVRLPLGATR